MTKSEEKKNEKERKRRLRYAYKQTDERTDGNRQKEQIVDLDYITEK